MAHRSPARWLAPLALVICAVTAYAVVQDGTTSGGDGATSSPAAATTTKKTGTTAHHGSSKHHHAYTVKSGDSLSTIAAAHGTTIAELQALNPSVDSSALHVGQKIRLPR